jgi:hypothetical protein
MAEKQQSEVQRDKLHLICIVCGASITKGNYCSQCIDRGFGSCDACEGMSLLDIEEN